MVSESRPACLVPISLIANHLPCWIQVHHTAQGNTDWVGILFSLAVGDQCGTESRIKQRVLKSGKEMIIRVKALGDQCGVCVSVQALGDRCEGSRTNLQGRSWTTIIFKSLIIDTLRKSSRMFDKSLNRPEGEQMLEQRVNVLILGLFMSTMMNVAVHLGHNYDDNLVACRNTNFDALNTLSDITQKLFLNQNHEFPRLSGNLLLGCDLRCHITKHFKWAKAKVHVYSDSVLCLGRMHGHPEGKEKRKDQPQYSQRPNGHRESYGIGEEPIEFEWHIFPGHATLQILKEIQKDSQDRNIEPENFEDRIIFISMFNDIEWTKSGKSEQCISNSEKVKNYAKRFSRGRWAFFGPGDEKKWY